MLMGPSEAKGVQSQIFNHSAANTTKIPLGSVEAAPQKASGMKKLGIKRDADLIRYAAEGYCRMP